MQLFFVRHGQTDMNAQKRIQGQKDFPLNAAGQAQAARLAEHLAELIGAGNLAGILSSDLSRAVGTAAPLAHLTGVELRVDTRLRERAFGQLEGLTAEELETQLPEAFFEWREYGDPVGVGVEPRADVGKRFAQAVSEFCVPQQGEKFVVVSHGSTITQGIVTLLGLDPALWAGLRGLNNCRYARLEKTRRKPGWRLVEYNVGPADIVS
ncbi:MAG: histidine phosphatase family protein [Actinomycetaceae bacterium]|nr:histidine phosphatase family protein [Actinomycetaceae bacterium]